MSRRSTCPAGDKNMIPVLCGGFFLPAAAPGLPLRPAPPGGVQAHDKKFDRTELLLDVLSKMTKTGARQRPLAALMKGDTAGEPSDGGETGAVDRPAVGQDPVHRHLRTGRPGDSVRQPGISGVRPGAAPGAGWLCWTRSPRRQKEAAQYKISRGQLPEPAAGSYQTPTMICWTGGRSGRALTAG